MLKLLNLRREIPLNLGSMHTPLPTRLPMQRDHGHPLNNLGFPIGTLDRTDFIRVVGQEFKPAIVTAGVGAQVVAAEAEIEEHGGCEAVGAGVAGMAQEEVGFHGVVAEVLEVVGFEFFFEADAAAFLAEVDDDAAAGGEGGGGVVVGVGFAEFASRGGDGGWGGEGHESGGFVELFAAIAAGGPDGFACVAFGVDADHGGTKFGGV